MNAPSPTPDIVNRLRMNRECLAPCLMDEIVATVSYYRSKALHLEAKEARREEREKRRKKD